MCAVKEGRDEEEWGINIYFFMKKSGSGSVLEHDIFGQDGV
jgi:hypothetical protein